MADDFTVVAEELVKRFDQGFGQRRAFSAVNRISFVVRRNTLFGFLGPNGAGKTTTIKMMTGLIFPSQGRIEVLGHSPTRKLARAKFGYLPENPSFPDHLTATELMRFSGRLLEVETRKLNAEIDRILSVVDLKRAANLAIRKFSKGMIQRLGIAQSLLGDPQLIILDEPMSGLDPIGRRDIKDLIMALRQQGKTVFFSTHIISDVEEICDDVAIVVNGRLARQGRVAEMLDSTGREVEITVRGLPADFAEPTARSGDVTTLIVRGEVEVRATLERVWAASGIVTGLRARRYGLEQVFIQEVQREPQRSPTVVE